METKRDGSYLSPLSFTVSLDKAMKLVADHQQQLPGGETTVYDRLERAYITGITFEEQEGRAL